MTVKTEWQCHSVLWSAGLGARCITPWEESAVLKPQQRCAVFLTHQTLHWLTDLTLQTASQTCLHLPGMMPSTFISYFWGSLGWDVTADILAVWCEEHGYIFLQSCIQHMGTRTHLSQVANQNTYFVRKNNLWEYPNDINTVWLRRQRP